LLLKEQARTDLGPQMVGRGLGRCSLWKVFDLDDVALLQLVDFNLARKPLLFNYLLTGQQDESKARILQTFDLPMTPADIRAPRLATGSSPQY
jgi:hypothetical protein